jgi:hypothetical protein
MATKSSKVFKWAGVGQKLASKTGLSQSKRRDNPSHRQTNIFKSFQIHKAPRINARNVEFQGAALVQP